jgi:D-galactarolactone cycloisomerase
MKIVRVDTHILSAPLTEPFSWSFSDTAVRATCLVEIETDQGLIGWGECLGPTGMVAAVIDGFRPFLIGADALATDLIWQTLYNRFRDYGQKGLVVIALSGVDIALWDLKGKHFGVPVHRLMGGPLRRTVRAYATGTYRLRSGDPFDYLKREVQGYAAEGFSAVKLKIGFDVDEDVALTHMVRDAIGPDVRLMVDANHGYDTVDAIRYGRLAARHDIDWFEEPVVPEDLGAYEAVKAGQPIPVAGGECEYTRFGFAEIMRRRSIDILQPDTCMAGGLSECKKIADMAVAFGLRYQPHAWGTAVGLSAALQLLAVLPHSPPRHRPREPMLEFDRSEHPFRQAVVRTPIEHVEGVVTIPDGPGLGIEIDRAALDRFRAVV